MTLLAIDRLRVAAGDRPLLRDVSLALAPGEILALTGESGSGKSLTALAAMGLLPDGLAATGSIRLDGTDLLRLPERELCRFRGQAVSMVFQEPMTALNPVQTIGAQVAEAIRVHTRLSAAEAASRAAAALARTGLAPDRVPPGRYPHELSGGQRQRVVIAMATALRPRLLIADEPTTALDVTTQARILALLRRLVTEDGMGLLLITHDLAVVHGIADRLAVMQDGAVVEAGPASRVFAERRHPYTRALFAAARHRPSLGPRVTRGPLLALEGVTCTWRLPRPRPFAPAPLHRAVDDVSVALRQGERVALVGESGCGKSTLTRAILGLEPLAAGRITLGGAPVDARAGVPRALRRRLQVVFQDPYGSFDPRHPVLRLVTEPLHLETPRPDPAEARHRTAAALASVGLDAGALDRPIHAFSGGQRQRIAIARALITRPDLVIFDEAVSALDVRVRAGILDLIARLSREEGLGYLFISHDLSVVRGIADRILVMQAGRIVEDAPTGTLFAAPRHPHTRALLAAAPHLPGDGDARAEDEDEETGT
ncbi:dipeptide ABC transporter ATP-binding protein [Roseivivax isoporae]|uniref:Microcin C ABC transporter ATP-binding protein YejF n=1 Tax=Roseivivax isoporae LMG 25204 TaxID=1449351 RepID=X7F3S1_9RHOB|nr:dipeptide ABC transporter ATP-binding protein [Roseivivax isoporae]ETX26756.1 microcin C ABC transporter ATP-binding protein YejF [Roseivivax isoporae LMG 25204]